VQPYRKFLTSIKSLAALSTWIRTIVVIERLTSLVGLKASCPYRWFSSAHAYEPDNDVLNIAVTFKTSADFLQESGGSPD
jgi:hypothetical protein